MFVAYSGRYGWGLSYTTFTYEWETAIVDMVLDVATVSQTGLQFTVTVRNTGLVSGDAVLLGFLHFHDRPIRSGK